MGHLYPLEARVGKQVDVLDLRFGRDRARFILQAVTRTDLDDAN
jgi:hypothetical protein